jgi:hypothetical protein
MLAFCSFLCQMSFVGLIYKSLGLLRTPKLHTILNISSSFKTVVALVGNDYMPEENIKLIIIRKQPPRTIRANYLQCPVILRVILTMYIYTIFWPEILIIKYICMTLVTYRYTACDKWIVL